MPGTTKSAIKAWETKRKNGFNGIKKGIDNPRYKKGKVCYSTIHTWLIRTYGKATKCEDCGITSAKKYEWANISKEYKRDIEDYKQLCVTCHDIYDDIYNKRPKDMYARGWNTRKIKYGR